jgi:pimeloyl-ACP methyl ester carboxylesterase
MQNISAETAPTSVIDISSATPTKTLMSSTMCAPHREGGQYFLESAVRIRTRPDLFGVVCEPAVPVANELPLVVLLNAGSSYRIGPGRLYVFLARQLAAQGFRTVRLDFNGIGDSVSSDSKRENDSYSATAFRDIELVLRDLEHRFGARKIVLMGLCSGAYVAFQAAAQIQNPVLVASVLINPLTFFWKIGMTVDDSPVAQLVSIHYYIGAALEPSKWLRLLTGRSQIGIAEAIKIVLRKVGLLRLLQPAARIHSNDRSTVVGPSHPHKEDLPGDLDRIVRKRRNLAMIFSTTDPGYSILTFHAKRKVKQLRRSGRLNVGFIAAANHTFSTRAAQQTLSREISDYLCRRYRQPN